MVANLPAYSGAASTCPKCKWNVVTTTYHRTNILCFSSRPEANCEHLCQGCEKCGYKWPEACADSGDDQRPDLALVQDIDEPGVGPGVSHARRHES
jgi:hypothetical protein